MSDTTDPSTAALIDLHAPLERQGPGDVAHARRILEALAPRLPAVPRVADLGCGAGAGTLLLADYFGCTVRAVDVSAPFIDRLEARARAAGLDRLVETAVGDMGRLAWPAASLDLLWSEGAAYCLGFEQALALWHPLLVPGGFAVVSELSWFSESPPAPARDYWQAAYPAMGSERENCERAVRAGYSVFRTERLSSEAWWTSYYGPLRARLDALRDRNDPAMRHVVRETEQEIELFERFHAHYGYTFYVLERV